MDTNHLLQGLIDHHRYLVEESNNVSNDEELKAFKSRFETYKLTCRYHLSNGNVKEYQVSPMIAAMRDIIFNIECNIDNTWLRGG